LRIIAGLAAAALVALAGTAEAASPAPAVRAAAAYLLNWRGLDARYAAQLFMAVVNCDKRGFPAYFEQFWSVVDDRPELARLDVVVPWLVTATSMPEFFHGLPRISYPLAAEAARILFDGEQPRYHIRAVPDRDANLLVVEDGDGHVQYVDDEGPQRAAIHRLIGEYLVREGNIRDLKDAWDANLAMLQRAVGDYRRQARGPGGTVVTFDDWAPRPEMRN